MKDAVAALSGLSLDPAELLHEADQRIRTVLPWESCWWTVDPETMLATELGGSGPRSRGDGRSP
ncbi:MAG: hypothetical protein ACRDPE_18660 [Solirubrobacterales bacterium]